MISAWPPLAAGCGSTAPGAATAARPTASLPLGTSVGATGATWAVLPMGAARAEPVLAALRAAARAAASWTAGDPAGRRDQRRHRAELTGARSLAAGVRPSQLLRFSPVTSTANGGRTWQAGPPDPGLAERAGRARGRAAGGQLLALDRDGRVEQGRARLDAR